MKSRSFVIVTESTSDLPQEYCRAHDITVLPYTFIIDDRSLKDDFGQSLSSEDFYALLREGKSSSTSMVNEAQYSDLYKPFLEAGKDILHLSFSSGLSGSCANAMVTAENMRKDYPDRKIVVVDTLAASLGFGLVVHYAVQMADAGKSLEETAKWIEDNKLRFIHLFTVDDLQHLRRGGRVSAAAALLGGLMGIKPLLRVDDEGHLVPLEKIRGRKNVLERMIGLMRERFAETPEGCVFISHGDSYEDAKWMEEEAKKIPGVKETMIGCIGPVIGSHSGPGTIALFFYGNSR